MWEQGEGRQWPFDPREQGAKKSGKGALEIIRESDEKFKGNREQRLMKWTSENWLKNEKGVSVKNRREQGA